jgi:hypothetical protein
MSRVLQFARRAVRPSGITATPDTVGLTKWFRADEAATGVVSSLPGKTGGLTLLGAGSARPAAAPSASFNNQQSIIFDGVDDQLTCAGDVIPLRPHTIWFAGRYLGAALTYLCGQTRSSSGVYSLLTNTSFRYEESTVVQSSATTTTTPCTLAFLVDAAGVSFVRNGVLINTAARTAVASGSGVNFALGSAIGSSYSNLEMVDLATGPLITVADCLSLHQNYAMIRYGMAA